MTELTIGGSPAAQIVSLQLVRNRSDSQDTVRCLRALLAQAEAGEIVGISYAVLSANKKLLYSSCGEAHRSPAYAAAMAATLLHGTMKRVFGED